MRDEILTIHNEILNVSPLREVESDIIYLSKNKSAWISVEWLSEELSLHAKENYRDLFDSHPLQRGKVVMFNNEECVSPRWHKSYLHQPERVPDQKQSYMYAGHERFKDLSLPVPFQNFLDFLNLKEETTPFNQVIINWYGNGKDYTAPHSDCEKDMVPNAGIAIVSLCEDEKSPRELRLTPKKLKTEKNDNLYKHINIKMKHGCIITMCGDTQKKFKHRIPKALDNPTSRISLTFRKFMITPT
jgi:alkylated DNA repair dioxygenase AlkB